jgi:hypothetical protein
MASFSYTVDTKPMAAEISSVSHNVNRTTGAVVAMQAAVIAVEEKAANFVCENVNRGFYSLIRSQISQKLAKLTSEVDSHRMQLTQQMKALIGIKMRMERDYHMISSRYTKLFGGLNTNLKTRVYELDKPVTNLVSKEVNKLANRPRYLTATIPVSQIETLGASQKILSSNIKNNAFKVIGSMNEFIQDMNSQKKLTDKILINKNNLNIGLIYLPVILIESNRENSNSNDVSVFLNEKNLPSNVKNSVKSQIFSNFSTFNWKSEAGISNELKSEFKNIIQNSKLDKRLIENIEQLYTLSKTSSI